MSYAGTLKFDTAMDASGFQKGADSLGSIVKGLGVFKLLEKGFDLVTASIDRAVLRYDTLNKFPAVLENMGYSAEASASATKKLSDGVQGLPTSLDEIAASAQQLTVLTGNLEDSTDTALALNNAFLASGAGAADASRGMVQYTQMLSKGKVDIISWRTLQETMGYALQETAKAFGFAGESAQNDLYAALRDGDITFSEFNAKLVELDQAVGGFAEMAKTSTGGIATAFTNMKTRVAAGVTKIITAIDSGLSQTRFKSIENIISSTGTAIKNVLAGIAGAFELVAANAEWLIPALVGVGAAVAAWKVAGVLIGVVQGFQMAALQVSLYAASVGGAITADAIQTAGLTAKEVLVGALTGKISLATAAQWVWNAAMSANPIGLVIAGVAALVAGIIALVSWIGKSNAAYKEGKQYVEDYGKANEELAGSFDESTENFKKNSNAAEANANASRDMLADMQALARKGLGRTAEETYKLQAKINNLNAAQKGLNLTIDDTTGELSLTNEEIEAYIAATADAARATALEDHMKALQQQLVDVESQFIDAERQISIWKQQVENGEIKTSQYEKLVESLNSEMATLRDTQAAILDEMAVNESEYSQVLARQEEQRAALIKAQEDEIRAFAAQHHLAFDDIMADMDENNLSFAEWIDENQKGLDKGQENIAEFAEKWGYSLEDVNAAIAASGLTIEQYVDQQDKALERATEVIADFTSNTTDGFSAMDQRTAISLDNFMENMRRNEEAVASWATNMNTLMDLGVNQGVIEQLSKMGPEGAAQAAAFVDELTKMNDGVDVALGETNAAVAAKLAEIDATFNTSLDTVSAAADAQLRAESYFNSGYASVDKIAAGIGENMAASETITDQMKRAKLAAGTVDFTEVGRGIAASVSSGLNGADVSGAMGNITSAITGNAGKVVSSVTSLSTQVQNVFRDMSTQIQGTVSQMMTQINSAITSRAPVIKTSAMSMSSGITQALNGMKTQVTSIIAQVMTNISSGIASRAGSARSAAATVASGVKRALEVMVGDAESVTVLMMDGMLYAMNQKAQELYAKAREIASNIASAMAAALDVRSPSRVMIKLFENVMTGIYKGMDGMEGLLYRKADSIADRLAERLAVPPDALQGMVSRMQAATESGLLGGTTLVPHLVAAGAGGISYTTNLTQQITTPKPLSASEMTREGQDLLRRQRWQLP